MSEITNANQLTKDEFRKLIRRNKTWYWIGGFAILAMVVGALAGGPIGAFLAPIVAIGAGLGITYWSAGESAEQAFYAAYAKSRGFERSDKGIGRATALLRKGDKRCTDEMFVGQLSPEFKGSLALFTFTNVSHDSKGNRQETDYPYTLTTMQLPEFAARVSNLGVQRKAGFEMFEKLEDAFRGKMERVELESEALDDRFEIFTTETQDPVFIRRLFSPSFVVWLTDHPWKSLAFEFENGKLCTYVPGHLEDNASLDGMIAVSCELAGKLQAEATA